MMAVHVIPTADPGTGAGTWVGELFAGRSAALFAVLAGVGLALSAGSSGAHMSRRLSAGTRQPSRLKSAPRTAGASSADELNRRRKAIAIRAVVIMVIGLLISMLESGVAIILVHYGLLFLLALPFLGWSTRALLGLTTGWVIAAPVAYWWLQNQLRPSFAEPAPRLWHSPQILDLFQPSLLGLDLFVTGYYPLILWPAYLFAGMAIGRLNLARMGTALRLTVLGTAGALISYGVGWLTLKQSGIADRMAPYARSDGALAGSLETGDHFLPLVRDPLWFLIPMPHQGSTMDLLHTLSCATAVLGLCLLLVQLLSTLKLQWLLVPLVGAGAMPLSLYVGHLMVLGPFWRMSGAPLAGVSETSMLLWLVMLALTAGTLKMLLGRRGPLEALTHRLSTGSSAAGR